MSDLGPITRRMYLTIKAMEAGAGMFMAMESVASVALEHPEWRMDELRSWTEWEGEFRAAQRRGPHDGLSRSE